MDANRHSSLLGEYAEKNCCFCRTIFACLVSTIDADIEFDLCILEFDCQCSHTLNG